MQDLLSHPLLAHPVIQSAVVPFAAGLIVALALRPVKLSGWAAVAGFAGCVYLAVGLQVLPLSATRKIVLLAGVAAIVGALLDFLGPHAARTRWLVVACAIAALLWVLYPALGNRALPVAIPYAVGLAAYCGVVAWGFDRLAAAPVNASAAGVAFGLGAGGTSIIGASALLGQMGLAIGSASAALLLVQMLTGRPWPAGRAFTLVASITAGLASAATVVLAKLPWYCLVPLAFVPLAAGIPLGERRAIWIRAIVLVVIAFLFSLLALFIAWNVLGPVPF